MGRLAVWLVAGDIARAPTETSGVASSSGLHRFGRGGAMVVGSVVEEAHRRSSRL
jgi:hypothetical protein